MQKQPFYNIEDAFSNFNILYGENKNVFQQERYKKAFTSFNQKYKTDCAYVASSSGRVEVCGNHTDHNGGKVLSCAISLDTLAMFLPTKDGKITITSEGYKDITVDTKNVEYKVEPTSSGLVKGIVFGLIKNGYKVGGFNAYITSNVLGGAGISSSASFELLICEILNFLYNDGKIDCEQKAIISQFSENKFFGKPCGLLDQTAISFGGLKQLDFSDPNKISVSDVKNKIKNFSFILVNTGGSHANLTEEYASIPSEMKEVAKCFGKKRLVELEEKEFFGNIEFLKDKVSDRAVLRAIHFYQENKRVENAVKALEKGNLNLFCENINGSGESSLWKLQNCCVNGSKEQPLLKAIALSKTSVNCKACRVHGGGFAGCVLNIVENKKVDAFMEDLKNFYSDKDIIKLNVRTVGTIVL